MRGSGAETDSAASVASFVAEAGASGVASGASSSPATTASVVHPPSPSGACTSVLAESSPASNAADIASTVIGRTEPSASFTSQSSSSWEEAFVSGVVASLMGGSPNGCARTLADALRSPSPFARPPENES